MCLRASTIFLVFNGTCLFGHPVLSGAEEKTHEICRFLSILDKLFQKKSVGIYFEFAMIFSVSICFVL
jgi:hypothetical protein